MTKASSAAAYGGAGWSPRTVPLRQEIGEIWATCGATTEWSPLKAVLLHPPGAELEQVADPNGAQMLAPLDPVRARQQHDALAQAYRDAGIAVYYVEPPETPPPNLMFVADLMFMTSEGAILGRPASIVRAGEERFVARRLAELGIPTSSWIMCLNACSVRRRLQPRLPSRRFAQNAVCIGCKSSPIP